MNTETLELYSDGELDTNPSWVENEWINAGKTYINLRFLVIFRSFLEVGTKVRTKVSGRMLPAKVRTKFQHGLG